MATHLSINNLSVLHIAEPRLTYTSLDASVALTRSAMSFSDSPPIHRLSSAATSSKGQEDLINAYEAEEERIINVLSRKLEQVSHKAAALLAD